MRYENNQRLRDYLNRGAAGVYREHMQHPRFEIDGAAFVAAVNEVRAQHPNLTQDEVEARAVFRLLTAGAPPEIAAPLPSRWYRTRTWTHRTAVRAWPWIKVLWAAAVLALCAIAAHAEPKPDELRAIRNAMAGWPAQVGQAGGLIIQFQNGGSVLATRPAGLVALNCSTNLTCSFSGTTFTVTASGGGGGVAGFDAITSATNTAATMLVGSGATLDFTGTGTLNANRIRGQAWSATSPNDGHIPIWNSMNSDWEPGDPIVSGPNATGIAPTRNPVQTGAVDNSAGCSAGPCVRSFVVASGAPGGGEYGLIVRNIPSGTQPVSGTVAATESGTWSVRAQDGSGNAITSTSSALDVNIKSGSITNTSFAATQSGTWTVQPGNTANTTPWLVKLNDGTNSAIVDPCQGQTKVYTAISQTSGTQLVTGTSVKKLYICHFNVVTATSQNIALMAGTGTVCATGSHSITGGTTAATGWNFAANGGIALGDGASSIGQTGTNADNICLLQSGSGQISGVLVTAVQ